MEHVVDFRMVAYIVPDGIVLPIEISKMLDLYIGRRVQNSKTGEMGTVYEIPHYLMDEWLVSAGEEVAL